MKRWLIWAGIIAAVAGFLTIALTDVLHPDSGKIPEDIEVSKDIPKIELELFTDSVKAPVAIESDGKSKSLYIAQQSGQVIKVNENGEANEQLTADLSDSVINKDEQGLLGLAFDPEFSQNGFVYVNYVEPGPTGRRTVVSRFTIPKGESQIARGSERRLFEIDQPYPNHNGGDITFGPDGLLYIALGDGGGKGDPQDNAQDNSSLLGKILRIDVTGESYTIPDNNPIISAGGGRPEILVKGLRNPWRISLDRDKNLWIGDVGQDNTEEVNLFAYDAVDNNFGWRCFEGENSFNQRNCDLNDTFVSPVATYTHVDQECGGSITGGFVYEGNQIDDLRGYYVYGDFCTGNIYGYNPESKENILLLETDALISTFGTDSMNELYVADYNGKIFKLTQGN